MEARYQEQKKNEIYKNLEYIIGKDRFFFGV